MGRTLEETRPHLQRLKIILIVCFFLMLIAMGIIGYQVIKYKALLTKDPMLIALNLKFQHSNPSCYCMNQLDTGKLERWNFNKTHATKIQGIDYN